MANTFRPPQGVRDEAARALKWIADGKAGSSFTDVGRARAAQLSRGDAVSADTILRMYSFFARHEVDKQGKGFNAGDDGYPSAGRVAWAAWGGDAGFSWSTKIRNQLSARMIVLEGEHMESRDIDENESTPDLPEELSELLADVISFYLRAHGAHWNVTGADFAEYHKLFGDIYEDVYSSVDTIAENLRKIGVVAPFQLPALILLRTVQDAEVGQDAHALAADLLAANEIILDNIADAFACATEYNQQGIANFLAERMDKHQFWKWQLTSSLGSEVPESDIVVDEETTEEESMTPRSEETATLEERKSAMMNAERITFNSEIRAVDTTDGSLRIGGYAAQFNKEATGLNFREVIAPGAFARSLQSDTPVFLLVNHDTDNLPLASTQSGTMTLIEDEVGLRMEATLDPSNPRAAELASALSRGDVDKMSFAFTVEPGGDTRENGLRTLQDLNLFEVSVVTWPAYDSTDVGMRAADDSTADADALELRKRLLSLKFKTKSLKK